MNIIKYYVLIEGQILWKEKGSLTQLSVCIVDAALLHLIVLQILLTNSSMSQVL